jgi:hypothetical protein
LKKAYHPIFNRYLLVSNFRGRNFFSGIQNGKFVQDGVNLRKNLLFSRVTGHLKLNLSLNLQKPVYSAQSQETQITIMKDFQAHFSVLSNLMRN